MIKQRQSDDLPPEQHFYRSFRAAMSRYLRATVRYNEILAAYQAKHPDDAVMAEIDAGTDRRFKVAANDQKFFGQEVIMYGIAYLVEQAARQDYPRP